MSKSNKESKTGWWVIGVLALVFVVVLNVASYSTKQQASSGLQDQEAQVSGVGGW